MKKQKEEKKRFPVLPMICGLFLFLLAAAYAGGIYYYRSHFLNGTVIDRVDVSGMTIGELQERIEDYMLRIVERKTDGTAMEEDIQGKDIDLTYASTEPLQEFLETQNIWTWFLPQTAEHKTENLLSYDEKKLETEKLADERRQQERERLGEAAEVIEEGQSYVRPIRQCNDEIPGEEMSDKLDRLELLVTRIFDQVEKEPELAPELRKMLSCYLPTTKKLLEAYRDLDSQQLDLSNIEQTKREIETAVDNINEAFEKFLDELFREKAWDIQSDISVLHTMMKQDGLL